MQNPGEEIGVREDSGEQVDRTIQTVGPLTFIK